MLDAAKLPMYAPNYIYRLGGGLLCLGLLYATTKIVYCIFLHPLRSTPGPWLNKISSAPAALMLVCGRQHSYYLGLHVKYGPIVRVAPNEIISNDAKSWEEIYGFRNGAGLDRAPTFIGTVAPSDGIVQIGTAKGKTHARHKRALAPFFVKTAVYNQREILHLYTERLTALVCTSSERGESINMTRWYAYFTFDIMTHVCFGEPYGCLNESPATKWPDAVFNLMTSATWDQAIRLLAGPDTWLSKLVGRLLVPAKAREWRQLHITYTREKIAQCASKGAIGRENVVRQICNAMQNNKPLLSPVEVTLDVATLLVAGAETSSILLAGLTYCLCMNSYAYEKLVREIRAAFTSAEDIELEPTVALPYLDAAVREACRIFPPAAVNNQRMVPPGGIFVQGVHLPEGTLAGISPWAASRSSANFLAPEEFHPERWMRDSDGRFAEDKLSASRPFGHGPNACLGEALAITEVKLLISKMLWQFDVRLETGQNESWSFQSDSRTMKSLQTLRIPDLWVRFEQVKR